MATQKNKIKRFFHEQFMVNEHLFNKNNQALRVLLFKT